MQLEWSQFDKPSEFGTEYRAWGVQSPYRIQLAGREAIVEKIGTGRLPHRYFNRSPETLNNLKAIAQQWENEDQRHLEALGYPEYPRAQQR
jgi:hypothetical protein